MKLHVLTAVSRPENLAPVAESIAAAAQIVPGLNIVWHWRFDIDRKHVGGQALKNEMLDEIDDGWVVILDDDTVMHKAFLRVVEATIRQHASLAAIVVSQKRTTGVVLKAAAGNVAVGSIDAGQVLLRRDLIGNHRLPETYAGDGLWLEALLKGRDDVVYLGTVLSLHNMLTGIDVSETPERMGA